MEMFVILTVELPLRAGVVKQATLRRTAAWEEAPTRSQVFEWALGKLPEELHAATVLFFSAEPNVISPGVAGERDE